MLGMRRAERYLAHREARARELGFDDLAAYYRQRYGDDGLRLDELAGELRCSPSAVRGDPAAARARPGQGALARCQVANRRLGAASETE